MLSAAESTAFWMWSLAYGEHEDRTPTHGYEPNREAAMQARQELEPRQRIELS